MNLQSASNVNIFKSKISLENELCKDIVTCAQQSIAAKGSFFLAVPGGSVLKMLNGLKDSAKYPIDWSKVYLFYVNHKCVEESDPSSTHLKARSIFLDYQPAVNVFPIEFNVGDDPARTVHKYNECIDIIVNKNNEEIPKFDYMLLGVGKDGHIGSLYPNRSEVTDTTAWVLPVDKKSPSSITLTLPVINNAKEIRVVLTGADKAESALIGIMRSEQPSIFPVCGVSTAATWMIDEESSHLVSSQVSCNFFE
eukprot:gene15318-20643_t